MISKLKAYVESPKDPKCIVTCHEVCSAMQIMTKRRRMLLTMNVSPLVISLLVITPIDAMTLVDWEHPCEQFILSLKAFGQKEEDVVLYAC